MRSWASWAAVVLAVAQGAGCKSKPSAAERRSTAPAVVTSATAAPDPDERLPDVGGRPFWHALFTSDPKAAAAFYGAVVGWRALPHKDGAGQYFASSKAPIAEASPFWPDAERQGVRPFWSCTVGVADVDRTASDAASAGGRVVVKPTHTDVSSYTVVMGPGGTVLTLARPRVMASVDTTTPGSFGWDELVSKGDGGDVRFWSNLMGWSVLSDGPVGEGGRYVTFGRDGAAVMGFQILSAVAAPLCRPSVVVADVDAAAARARELGASILFGPADVGGVRIAALRDPQGAELSLRQTKK